LVLVLGGGRLFVRWVGGGGAGGEWGEGGSLWKTLGRGVAGMTGVLPRLGVYIAVYIVGGVFCH
jgi:hypothetical protein